MSVIIHLGGQIPSKELAMKISSDADLIIAADSGYDSCLKNEVVPDIVTGDFDSIVSQPDITKTKIIPSPEQNATDFEKALRLVPAEATCLEILGGTGLRSDHFLTNLLIASGQPPNRKVVFYDDLQSIHRVTPECPLEITLDPETIISLIPFSDCSGTSTKGLFWNLFGTDMGPEKQFGQSNKVVSPDINVRIRSGRLFVVINQLQNNS